jgi:hypothetical protein
MYQKRSDRFDCDVCGFAGKRRCWGIPFLQTQMMTTRLEELPQTRRFGSLFASFVAKEANENAGWHVPLTLKADIHQRGLHVRYRVATKHFVSIENRFPSFVLKKGGCCAKVRDARRRSTRLCPVVRGAGSTRQSTRGAAYPSSLGRRMRSSPAGDWHNAVGRRDRRETSVRFR